MKKLTLSLTLTGLAVMAPVSLMAQDAVAKPAVEVAQKDTAASIADQFLTQMLSIGNSLKDVKDEAGAKAAVTKIDAATAQMVDLEARLKKLPKPDAATRKAINAKMDAKEAEMEASMGSVSKLMQDPVVGPILMPAMMKFGNTMMQISPTFSSYYEDKEAAAAKPAPAPEPKAAGSS